jgi:soluble lytic murein transglycosylase
VEYWELGARLGVASVDEVEAFYGRWKGSYVEDRLRNDFLLELGRRRDWPAFARDFPRFRMNDDREVTCYALLTQHEGGQDVQRRRAHGLARPARRRRRLQPARAHAAGGAPPAKRRRLAQGVVCRRGRPAARRARGAGAAGRGRGERLGRCAGQPLRHLRETTGTAAAWQRASASCWP